VAALKKLNLARVFNDYDFGGYLIANGVAPFIDGRTELYGEKFFVDHNAASGLMQPENLFRLLDQYRIEATLMRTQSAATKRPYRRLAEGLCRRHRHHPRPQGGRGAYDRAGGRTEGEVASSICEVVIPGRCEASNPESKDSPMRNCASEVWC
jgi:hypothetical protein